MANRFKARATKLEIVHLRQIVADILELMIQDKDFSSPLGMDVSDVLSKLRGGGCISDTYQVHDLQESIYSLIRSEDGTHQEGRAHLKMATFAAYGVLCEEAKHEDRVLPEDYFIEQVIVSYYRYTGKYALEDTAYRQMLEPYV